MRKTTAKFTVQIVGRVIVGRTGLLHTAQFDTYDDAHDYAKSIDEAGDWAGHEIRQIAIIEELRPND